MLIGMNYVQSITKIKGKGQLTIPQEVRDALQWSDEKEVAVKVKTIKNGFKVERVSATSPQQRKKLTKEEAAKIWADMKRISKLGKRGVNLTEFLRHDRDTHF